MSEFRNTVFQYFQTDDIPSEEQFQYTWNSVWFKDEKFSISDVTGLEIALQNKLGTNHASDANAHANILLKKDGSNLSDAEKAALKIALDVGEIPDNVALVDMGEPTDVFNKDQIRALYMSMADYIVGGKIRADKIEALGLTTLIEVSQTSLASFAANSANYTFEQNDMIAIPDGTGNFALFIFKGGVKTVTKNYLPTGLTNITIAMVEGLQTALDSKVQKPAGTGGFFASQNGNTTTWVQISPASYYLNYWDGSNFRASNVYQNGTKLGIGTQTPSEMLHLYDGRIRAKALVLDVNSETLPNQITTDGTRFSGTSSAGTKRGLMYNDYADLLGVMSSMNDTQKDNYRIASRKTNENYSLNQPVINNILPPIVDKTIPFKQYITIVGLNLFLDTITQGAAQIEMKNVATGAITLISNFTSYQYSPDRITFGLDFSTYDIGDYTFRVFHNGAWSLPNLTKVLRIRNALTSLPIPSLTWSLANQNGAQTSIAGVTTTTDRVVIDTKSAQTSIYAQSSYITTQQEMSDGVLLVFSVEMRMYDDPSFSQLMMGFVNSVFVNNDYADFGVSTYGLYPSTVYAKFKQSGQTKTLPNSGFVVADLVYVTIKNGVAEILFLNSGVNAIEVIPFTTPLSLKVTNKRTTTDITRQSKIDCQLINKYSLS